MGEALVTKEAGSLLPHREFYYITCPVCERKMGGWLNEDEADLCLRVHYKNWGCGTPTKKKAKPKAKPREKKPGPWVAQCSNCGWTEKGFYTKKAAKHEMSRHGMSSGDACLDAIIVSEPKK